MTENRDELIQHTVDEMRQTFRRLRTNMAKLFEDQIPLNEWQVLKVIALNGEQIVSKVAQQLNVTNSHITAVSERLIGKGLIVRERSDKDRRIVFLRITEEGQALFKAQEQRQFQYFKEQLASCDMEDLQTFTRVLNKLGQE